MVKKTATHRKRGDQCFKTQRGLRPARKSTPPYLRALLRVTPYRRGGGSEAGGWFFFLTTEQKERSKKETPSSCPCKHPPCFSVSSSEAKQKMRCSDLEMEYLFAHHLSIAVNQYNLPVPYSFVSVIFVPLGVSTHRPSPPTLPFSLRALP